MVYRPTEKTKNHREQRRLMLISAATALVNDGGFSGLSIEALAKSAGVAVGTVYKYFDSKASLCAEVFNMATEKEVAIVQSIADRNDSALNRLSEAIATLARRAMRSRTRSYALIFEPVDPKVEKQRLRYRKSYAIIFEAIIKEGIVNQEFINQPASLAASAIVGIITEVIIRPLTEPENIEQDECLVADIQQFCLRYLV